MNVLKRAVILIAENLRRNWKSVRRRSNATSVFARPTKTKHTIRISFGTFAAPLVQERQWHPSREIKQLRNGGIELSLTLGNLEEIERWILSWGNHAQVLAPAEPKSQIAKTVSALADTYGTPV